MQNQLQQLLEAGQSVWLDNLRRSMFASGELQSLIDRGLRGMTSNPTIFEKAIGSGNDYDEQLGGLIGKETDPTRLFWELAIKDIQSACDAFAGVYQSSGGNDGFVSLEVSPLLAHDTAGTVAMAKDLWQRVDRKNLMVKIPGTTEGVGAIEECIYQGLNINVTLIFSIDTYEKTAQAYIRGIERRVKEGKPVDTIRSVNSVFVSRIDTAVDKLLQARIDKGEKPLQSLLGKAGVANLKLTYQKFLELFEGETFAPLRAKGAAVQRPLWASTSTKNPNYNDLMYVEPLVGPNTVNTMPPQTLEALMDHGEVRANTVIDGVDDARATMARLAEAKISLFEVTHDLQIAGVSSFSESFAALLGAIVYKQKQLQTGSGERISLALADGQSAFEATLKGLQQRNFLKQFWAKDASLWSDAPDHAEIIHHALGWLDIPQRLVESVTNLKALAKEASSEFSHVVVLGMGGSSLAPDILSETFGKKDGFPQLHVLDSTDPVQIGELEARIDHASTLFIVASKSGTTTEPDAFYRYFHERVTKAVGSRSAGSRFVAITDPGTALEKEATAQSFRACFLNDANIGGRYSALSYFGMLPAALAGYDVELLLDRALGAMHANDKTVAVDGAPGVRFGAAIGSLAKNGRDKLTIVTHPTVHAFGAWAEQLIAESTGKNGTGIVPVAEEPLGAPDVYGRDRVFVYVGAGLEGDDETHRALQALEGAGHPVIRLAMNDRYDVGEQFYQWEIATATAGCVLGIDAFDQPNVQESKDNTKALLKEFSENGRFKQPHIGASGEYFDVALLSGTLGMEANGPEGLVAGIVDALHEGDYVAFLAYIARNEAHVHFFEDLRTRVRDAKRVATTVGFGPRFLHSTGQEHKGGPNSGVFFQITADEPTDMPIPGMNVGFRTLIAAQALGDLQSLDKRQRRGARIHLHGDVDRALQAFADAIDRAVTARA